MCTIVSVERADLCEVGATVKCATNIENRVRITRVGMNYIVSPSDPEGFINAIRQTICPSYCI